ncbi:aquaporin-3-like [Styela clava]|uniref:aquaporin-3-like n=1 Tax=Styela clava TaxID=7725 RepID=UPI00193955D9|nr:aquaporin-3-like [Styela clava]
MSKITSDNTQFDHANAAFSSEEKNISLPGGPESGYTDLRKASKSSIKEMPQMHKKRGLRIQNKLLRECMAECLGTFILMIFGNGSVAQTVLSKGGDGNYLTIYWGYGIGVAMGVYVAGGVSGAHLNPAVSLAMSVVGRLEWKKLPLYVLWQVIGAFLSAPVVYGIYYDALEAFDGGERQVFGPNATASIFATYPKEYLSLVNGVFDQIFGTAVLLCGVFAITDNRNNKPPSGMEPLLVGLLVFALGNSYGTNCGYAINPARDFGPRLFTAMAGWGGDVFTAPKGQNWSWWWVPILGPLMGGVLGAFVYLFVVGLHWPPPETPLSEKKEANSTEIVTHSPRNPSAEFSNHEESSLIVQAQKL